MGWKFTTTSAITVVALDAYDPEPGSGHVWLYDSLDDVLATAIVSLSDAMVGAPQAFYSHSVTPVTLAAGQTYYIAEDYDGTAAAFPQFYANVGSLTTASQIQYGGGTLASGLDQFPTHDSLFGGTTNPAYFGPNFEIAPEPSTLALGAGALVGLAVLRRRKVHGKVR
jgi:hypothetical protein